MKGNVNREGDGEKERQVKKSETSGAIKTFPIHRKRSSPTLTCCSHPSSPKQKCQTSGHYPFYRYCNINQGARGTVRQRDFGKVTLTRWRPAKAGGRASTCFTGGTALALMAASHNPPLCCCKHTRTPQLCVCAPSY